MDNIPKNVIEEWKEIYLYLLKKETLYRDGKRLVLKNPANTARVTLLLEMFPNARFVHISVLRNVNTNSIFNLQPH
jgi:hypothetical protein